MLLARRVGQQQPRQRQKSKNEMLAACKTLASTRMQPFEYPSVRLWSKESNGTLTGGQKN